MFRKPTYPLPSHYLETLLLEKLLQSQDNLEAHILKSAKNDLIALLESLPEDILLQCIQTLFSKKGGFEHFDPITGLFKPNVLTKLTSEGFHYTGQFAHTSHQYLVTHLKYTGKKQAGHISEVIQTKGVEVPENHALFGSYGDQIKRPNKELPMLTNQLLQGGATEGTGNVIQQIRSEIIGDMRQTHSHHLAEMIRKLQPNSDYFIPVTKLLKTKDTEGISREAIQYLLSEGILFIGQLRHFSEKNIQEIRWFGPKKTAAFSRFLADEYNIFLKTGDTDRDSVFEY